MLQKLHHVAYRCKDAATTTDFYTKVLGLKFAHAIRGDMVPSTGAADPHLHIFFEMQDGSYIAFFELPAAPPAQRDPATPDWVQHLALEVESEAVLESWKARLDEHGVSVVGPTDHGFCRSIYFFDPNGHRLELTARTTKSGDGERYLAEAPQILQRWAADKLKRASA
jgi:Lactoylglutathione lyase and related lyases